MLTAIFSLKSDLKCILYSGPSGPPHLIFGGIIMNYIEAIKKEELIKTTTEKGDVAFKTSGSYCLDFYSLMGGMRTNYLGLNNLFLRSYYEDRLITLKIMLHLRDILGGLGERNSFRMTFNLFANLNPNLARQLIPLIPQYGRYDDLFAGMNTKIESDVLKYIETQLDKDLENLTLGKEISLLPKWLPSINTSSKSARLLARKVAKHLGLTHKEYRQMLSKLRKGNILENHLREKDYSFDYRHVPSQAFLKYVKAFYRHDGKRLERYLDKVDAGDAKMNTKTAQTVQVAFKHCCVSHLPRFYDTYWKALPKFEIKTKAIIVRDGSGSMLWGLGTYQPIEVATSLALYFAEQLPEPFKNHFITFSENPQLINIPEGTLEEKLDYIRTFNDVANTNISKVYELLLNVAKKNEVKQKDMVEQVIIISDMQFDRCVEGQSTFETYKEKFQEIGLKMPELIFWNVAARDIQTPVTANELGVKLVSGGSQKIIELVVNNELEPITPYEFMLKVLEKYNEVDKFLK